MTYYVEVRALVPKSHTTLVHALDRDGAVRAAIADAKANDPDWRDATGWDVVDVREEG